MSFAADPIEPLLNACPACELHIDVTDLEPFAKIQCPHCVAPMRVRTAFDHFQLIEQIGQGGMSRVFRATDSLLNRDVALKVLNHECGSDSERIVQFEREARITASFSHPNVVKVFSVGEDQGYFYIAMELVSYSSFESVITRRGRVSEGEVLNIGIAVTQGLLAAHGAGLIHRDIKPGNVLFAEDGTAKIVDFGLALVVERDVDTSAEIWATPYYVAPEKLTGGTEDFRSDQYSLGATLYHALAGVPPVEAATTSIDELRKLKAQPVDIGLVVNDVTRPTAEVINRMLAHDPSDRFDSYEQLTEALHAAKQGKVIAPLAEPSRWKMKALIGGSVAGLVLILLVMFFQGSKENDGSVVVLDETTSGANSSSGSFLKARELLLSGQFADAAALFIEVAESATTQQPTVNWALFNLGLCHLLQFNEDSADGAFRAIVANGVYSRNREELDRVSFFLDVAKQVQAQKAAGTEQLNVFRKRGYECVALLPMGLRWWGSGDTGGGAALLQEFQELARVSNVEWIVAYAKLATPFLDDARVLSEIPDEPEEGSADEIRELGAFLSAGEKGQKALSISGGPHRSDLELRLAGARARLAVLRGEGAEATAKLALRRLNNDRVVLERELNALAPLLEQLQLMKCVEKVQSIQLRTEQGIRERDAWVNIFQDAEAFVKSLDELDLGTSFRGPVILRQGIPLHGTSYRISEQGIRVRQEGQPTEKEISFRQCAPLFLLTLGNRALLPVTDSDRYLEMVERLVSFARIYELAGAVETHLNLLADATDKKLFGAERLKILVDDPGRVRD